VRFPTPPGPLSSAERCEPGPPSSAERCEPGPPSSAERCEPGLGARPAAAGSLPLGALLPWALAAFAYVGLETALSVFAVPHAQSAGFAAERGLRALSGFWLGLLLARVGFAALRRPARLRQLRLAGGAGALVLGIGACVALPPEALFCAAGLALGVVFPLLVSFAGEAAPLRRATAVGIVVGAGSLGGFLVPWAAGALGDRFGTPAVLALLAVLALAIAAAPRATARAR
jgi:fucose permease